MTTTATARRIKAEAVEFLQDLLGKGEMPAKEVETAARNAGIPQSRSASAKDTWSRYSTGRVWPLCYLVLGTPDTIDALDPHRSPPRTWATMDPEAIYEPEDEDQQVVGAIIPANAEAARARTDVLPPGGLPPQKQNPAEGTKRGSTGRRNEAG